MSDLIPWWSTYGTIVPLDELRAPRARSFVRYIERAATGVATIVEARCEAGGDEAVLVEVQTGRPQMPAIPLRSREPVAFRFVRGDARQPGVHPLRPDFPRTTHQSWAPRGQGRKPARVRRRRDLEGRTGRHQADALSGAGAEPSHEGGIRPGGCGIAF